jgi:hypothetical protein
MFGRRAVTTRTTSCSGFKETWVALSDAGQHETRTTRSGMEYDLTGTDDRVREPITSNLDSITETVTLAWRPVTTGRG